MSEIVEYWDAYLKTQSKGRLKLFHDAVKRFNAEITNSYSEKWFKDKLAWRNPIYFKVRLPKENGCTRRWDFILACKCQVILDKPPKIGIPELNWNRDRHQPLMGNHTALSFQKVRTYRINPTQKAYIKDHVSGVVLEGVGTVVRVLVNGELDLTKKDRENA
ncbi:hypothetical protein 2AV2_157 [Nodularia phage vB_NpeS-2AV2]|uniref:Uncharacterized protein n=1 Tax=Nodularia phage vB_NpeS-2AV2 TaxID=1777122 RepID=A0A1L2BX42_9CAUD|nr:hypothetical protein HWA92_gp157 [Nodularia phage vB_NpeS-2AV2]ALY07609.1 hypothetical protein 2AV2_157 [Nodularia phage vB_NpeS-2AV2]